MKDNELRFARMVMIKNIVVIVMTAVLVLGLYYMSNSLLSLLGLCLILACTTVKCDDNEDKL